jgi:hypothetical protein
MEAVLGSWVGRQLGTGNCELGTGNEDGPQDSQGIRNGCVATAGPAKGINGMGEDEG